jgi:bifunctional UDP-N-acetylglucosamine pyrophosphorylase/glucosamine-1-phosphate N-acetyltransferase
VKEFNISYYCFDFKWLCENIGKLTNHNVSGEYYLTDMVHIAIEQGRHVDSYAVTNVVESLGINSPEQLHMVEEAIDE